MRVRGKPAIETGPPLLEREASLALLTEYAAQAAGGEGRLVLLSGEAGVGKSALVERLCRDLPDARTRDRADPCADRRDAGRTTSTST